MSRFLMSIFAVFTLFLIATNTVSPAKDIKFQVEVIVSSDDLQSTIKGYLHQALRHLDDVSIDEYAPYWKIFVVHQQRANGCHEFATAVLTPPLREWLNPNLDEELQLSIYHAHGSLDHLQVSSGGSSLKEMCESIVASIDASVIEPRRQAISKQNAQSYLFNTSTSTTENAKETLKVYTCKKSSYYHILAGCKYLTPPIAETKIKIATKKGYLPCWLCAAVD